MLADDIQAIGLYLYGKKWRATLISALGYAKVNKKDYDQIFKDNRNYIYQIVAKKQVSQIYLSNKPNSLELHINTDNGWSKRTDEHIKIEMALLFSKQGIKVKFKY